MRLPDAWCTHWRSLKVTVLRYLALHREASASNSTCCGAAHGNHSPNLMISYEGRHD